MKSGATMFPECTSMPACVRGTYVPAWCRVHGLVQDGALDRGTRPLRPPETCQPDPSGSGCGEPVTPTAPPPTPHPRPASFPPAQ